MWLFEGPYYLHPERAYLFWGVPCILLLFWWAMRQRRRQLALFDGQGDVPKISEDGSQFLLFLKVALLSLAWMMTCVALMSPYTPTRTPAPASAVVGKRQLAHDVILMIDTSASMGVVDGRSNESRLSSAKQIAEELVKQLHGESVALYTFTTQPIPEVPLTLDYLFVRLMIQQLALTMEEATGTDFAQSLAALRAKYWNSDKPVDRSYSLVLFSDGGDSPWEAAESGAKVQRLQAIVDVLAGVKALQIVTVGVGSTEGGQVPNVTFQDRPVQSALEPQILQALASPDGKYIIANQASAYETGKVIANLVARHAQYRESTTPMALKNRVLQVPPVAHYHFPLTVAILSLIAALLLPLRLPRRSAS